MVEHENTFKIILKAPLSLDQLQVVLNHPIGFLPMLNVKECFGQTEKVVKKSNLPSRR